jgi:sialate O-acetylesterase
MVLQQQKPVPVWGTAAPGEEVTVSLAGQSVTTKADASGAWKALRIP